MKEGVVIKVNYPTKKRWITRAEFVNMFPGLICLIIFFVFSKMDIAPLAILALVGMFISLLFAFFPFYLNGKIAVTAEGLQLVQGRKQELLPWNIITKMHLETVEGDRLQNRRDYVKLTITLKYSEVVAVCFCQHLWSGAVKQTDSFILQCRQVPGAEEKFDNGRVVRD